MGWRCWTSLKNFSLARPSYLRSCRFHRTSLTLSQVCDFTPRCCLPSTPYCCYHRFCHPFFRPHPVGFTHYALHFSHMGHLPALPVLSKDLPLHHLLVKSSPSFRGRSRVPPHTSGNSHGVRSPAYRPPWHCVPALQICQFGILSVTDVHFPLICAKKAK